MITTPSKEPISDGPLEFSTYLVDYSSSKWVRLMLVLVAVLLAGTLMAYIGQAYNMVTVLFSACLGVVIIFAIARKGKIQAYGLSEDKLVITPDTITIAGAAYDIRLLRDLTFLVHSYAGMDYSSSRGYRSNSSDGMKNSLSFSINNERVEHNFYLNSAKHTAILCQVFKAFYSRHIPFIEMDYNGNQTYLLQRLSKEELEGFKMKYGYKEER